MNSIEKNPGASEKPAATVEAGWQINSLKQETAPLEKARKLFGEKSFGIETATRLRELESPPALTHEKLPYSTLFHLHIAAIRNEIFDFFHAAVLRNENDETRDSAVEEFIEKKIAEFKKLDKNGSGKIEYAELADEEVRAGIEGIRNLTAFSTKLQKSEHFNLQKNTVGENAPGKRKFIGDYLKNFGEKMIDRATGEPTAGSRLQLARMLHSMTLWVVGGRQLTNEEFKNIWEETKKADPNLQKIYSGGSGSAEKARDDFEKLGEFDDEKIVNLRKEIDKKMIEEVQRMRANPHGHFLRKMGGLENVLVYFGKDALIATIILNLALAGFSPTKFLSSPVALGSIAAVAALAYHYDPEAFAGKSPVEKIREDKLKKEFGNTPDKIKNWISQFRKSDLEPKSALGKLLAEKGRTRISSAELGKILDESKRGDEKPSNSIDPNSDAAKKIFWLFKSCRQNGINPSSLRK